MSGMKLVGLVLIALGILGLAYKGFTYTKSTSKTDLGPFQIRYSDKEHVDVPMWVGVLGIVAGAACLVLPGMKSARA
ncbi:MAG: hypothetical protein FD180_3300 [Planctomycetota bacterium]|nr:MAG: hypothetical protein FD180_3300 [Planctomycetota bacterium]